ncbi:MAG: T9SS type A sorting domain-containing protein, partial [Bacteroidota bacterium]|nr:T9SS type A sorting domain-containing protein [Bacteroidota bacterium]
STVTDAYGCYSFTPLLPGTYTVSEILQLGWTQCWPLSPGIYTVTLGAGETIGPLNFGNRLLTPDCPPWKTLYDNVKIDDMGFKIPTVAKKMTRNLAVAANGDVYVTGYSKRVGTGYDYVTIVYDQNGATKLGWPQYYNGPMNRDDKAYALAIDASGNVYVTGESQRGKSHGVDITTISYDQLGNLRWQAHYSGTPGCKDAGYAIAVDPTGTYVYVTGESFRHKAHMIDYITLCYATAATGINPNSWANTYNGPGNGNDKAYAIAVCPVTGDVAVTGESQGSGTNADIATVRYNSIGTTRHIYDRYNASNRDDYGFGITFNKFGDLFVVGASYISSMLNSTWDYTTLKYNATSQAWVWVKHYNGGNNDFGYHLATDDAGDVYVTGASKIASPLIPVNGMDTGYDYATLKYRQSDGMPLWPTSNKYDGIKKQDIARAITVCDVQNKVFVTGSSHQGVGRMLDYVTLKIDAISGTTDWVGKYNGTSGRNDIAYNVAVRPLDCCVILTGTTHQKVTYLDFATIQGPPGAPVPGPITTPTGYDGEDGEYESELPITFTLYNSYPNPFNPITTIRFTLPEQAYVTLKVYNVLGQEMGKLFDRELLDDGAQKVEFDASNLTSGVYFYRIVVEGIGDEDEGTIGQTYVSVKKMILLR